MKPKRQLFSGFVAITLAAPAFGETIYSNLQDIAIPTDFTGVTLNLEGGTINPFFGGVGVANNDLLQPVRSGSGQLDTILNLSIGSVIDAGDVYATGYGGSQTHLGTTFTAGQEGIIGFQLNGTDYGWMRVVFTGNEAGAVIKDWAYDDSGMPMVVGRVNQSAADAGTQLVTLSPGTGESFALGSLISDTGGNVNSVLKTGAGTTILTQSNTYTGTTSVSNGTLVVDGNISTSALTTVDSGATLAGSGTTGNLTVASGGTLAPGSGIDTLGVAGDLTLELGSISNFEIDTTGNISDLVVSSALLTFGGTLNVTNIGGTLLNGDTFNLFDWGSTSGAFSSVNLPGLDTGLTWDQSNLYVNGQIAVVPEPAAALLGGLGLLALLRRRR
jgi:autotransporter-associated beta strand protein